MIIKKFQADTEVDAMIKVKEDMGSDAIVMNIKTIKPRGIMLLFKKPVVEVTAALDEQKSEKSDNESSRNVKNTMGDYESKLQFDLEAMLAVKNAATAEKSNDVIEERLASLHALLQEKLISDEKESTKKKEYQEKTESEIEVFTKMIYNKLLDQEIDEKYANQIIDEIEKSMKKDTALDYVLSTVYQKMILKMGESKPIQLTKKKPKVVFFIGPTGVGKTTTIAKIASKFALEEQSKVVMLTADTYRISATEQLRTYANILSVPFKVIYTPEEIKSAVEEFSESDLILVDTAGHAHRNVAQLADIKELLSSIQDEEQKEIYLVLSMTTKYRDLLGIVDSYKEIHGFKLIFTKLDETTCFGNILNMKLYTDADLSYLTCGQNVPDDLERLDAQKLVKQLLGGK